MFLLVGSRGRGRIGRGMLRENNREVGEKEVTALLLIGSRSRCSSAAIEPIRCGERPLEEEEKNWQRLFL